MNARGGYAFLVEMTAVILFFALVATAVITLFVGADKRAKEAAALSGAVLAASSAAELVRTSASPEADFSARYGATEAEGGYEAWLDPSFLPGGLQEYILRLECGRTGGMCEMTVSVMEKDGEELYSLSCARFMGGGS